MILFDYPLSAQVAWGLGLLIATSLLWRSRRYARLAGLAFPTERTAGLRPSWRVRLLWLPGTLRVLAIMLLFAALARPQLQEEESAEVEGIDIVVALDLSGSMSAVDLSMEEVIQLQHRGERPKDRFQSAVEVLSDFIRSRRYDRVSLITFGKEAFLQFPLTLDYGVMLSVLKELALGDIDGSGTAIGDALARGLARLEESEAKSKLIILITDGEDIGSRLSPLDIAAEAKRRAVPIFPILVGREGSSLQPNGKVDAFSGAQLYDQVENPVNPSLLKQIASTTSGQFYRALDRAGLEEDFQDILDTLEKSRLVDYTSAERRELFPELIWLALACLALELLGRELLFTELPLMPFRLAHPELWWLAALPLVAFLLWSINGLRRRRLAVAFGEHPLVARLLASVSPEWRLVKRICLFLALAALSLAALRPQYGRSAELQSRAGIDIAVAFDISKSMLARDLLPSRLEAAKRELGALLKQLNGHRVALIPFAGIAFTQSPLTADQGAIRLYMKSLDPRHMPIGGTNLAMAIDEAVKRLTGTQDRGDRVSRSRVLLLITDGEDLSPDAGAAAKEAAKRAAVAGVMIYAVAVGTPSGEPIPLFDAEGNHQGYQRGQDGRPLYSQLNRALLVELARLSTPRDETSNARVISLDQGEGASRALARAFDLLQRGSYEASLRHRYNESYHYAVIPALLFLLIELLLTERRRREE